MAQITLSNVRNESVLIRGRLLFSVLVMFLLVLVLLAHLFYLQITQHEHYSTRSQDNRLRVEPVAPTRGLIFSRDGVVLAENRPSFSLAITPERVEDINSLIEELATIVPIDEHERSRFEKQLRAKRRFEKVTLKAGLTQDEVARFSVDSHRFPAASIVAQVSRYYPHAERYAHVVGYVGRIDEKELEAIDPTTYAATTHIGKTGIEKTYEQILHGEVGYQQVEVNAQGRIIRVLDKTEPSPGKDLYLTLDDGLQRAAEAVLADRRGAVVVTDVVTGGVLAMASTPSFDPNLFVNGIRTRDYKPLRDSQDRPLFNRALQGQYPPGSTVKPFVALAGLTNQVFSKEDKVFCPGWFSLPGDDHRYRCWKKTGHSHVDMHEAIAQSCDVYFYALSDGLGIDRLSSFLGLFGFGSRTGVDIPGEATGLMPSSAWKRRTRSLPWYPGETLIAGIGQGFVLATPMQLAVSTATLARRGRLLRPHVLGQIEDPMSKTAAEAPITEEIILQDVESVAWDAVLASMQAVVNGPTGTARRVGAGAAVAFGGKTGTAQLFAIAQDEEIENEDVTERLRDHALFIAYAPVDTPEIAISVIIENGGSGSGTAAPVARAIVDYYFAQSEQESVQESIDGT